MVTKCFCLCAKTHCKALIIATFVVSSHLLSLFSLAFGAQYFSPSFSTSITTRELANCFGYALSPCPRKISILDEIYTLITDAVTPSMNDVAHLTFILVQQLNRKVLQYNSNVRSYPDLIPRASTALAVLITPT
jgi:hypothetical protein